MISHALCCSTRVHFFFIYIRLHEDFSTQIPISLSTNYFTTQRNIELSSEGPEDPHAKVSILELASQLNTSTDYIVTYTPLHCLYRNKIPPSPHSR